MPTYYSNDNLKTGWRDKFKKLYKKTKKVGITVASPFKTVYDKAKNKYTKYQDNRRRTREYKLAHPEPPRRIASRAKSWLTKRKNNVVGLATRGKNTVVAGYETAKEGTLGKYQNWRTKRANNARFNAQKHLPETREDTQFLDKFKITKITHPNKLYPELEIYMLEDGQYTVISKGTLHKTIANEYPEFYEYLNEVPSHGHQNYTGTTNDMKIMLGVYFPKGENKIKYDYQVPETINFVTDLDKAYRVYLNTSKEQTEKANQPETPAEQRATLWEAEFPATNNSPLVPIEFPATPTRSGSRTSSQRGAKSLSGRRQSRRSNQKPDLIHSV